MAKKTSKDPGRRSSASAPASSFAQTARDESKTPNRRGPPDQRKPKTRRGGAPPVTREDLMGAGAAMNERVAQELGATLGAMPPMPGPGLAPELDDWFGTFIRKSSERSRSDLSPAIRKAAKEFSADPTRIQEILYSRKNLLARLYTWEVVEETFRRDLSALEVAKEIRERLDAADWPFEDASSDEAGHPFCKANVERGLEIASEAADAASERLREIDEQRRQLGLARRRGPSGYDKVSAIRDLGVQLCRYLAVALAQARFPGKKIVNARSALGLLGRGDVGRLQSLAVELVNLAHPGVARLTKARLRASTSMSSSVESP